jgi:hypothetical protein
MQEAAMPDVNLPLSGPVIQTFPWANYPTINVGTSSNPAIEKDALSDVASYGKQLGRIGDALIVLLRHLPHDAKLRDDEKTAIDDLKSMLHELANVKERHGAKKVLRP